MIDRTRGHLRLRRRKLQSQVARCRVGRLSYSLGGFILVATELIGVGEFGFHIRFDYELS